MKRAYLFTTSSARTLSVGIVLLVLILISCKQQPDEESNEAPELLVLTEEQFAANRMELAPVSTVEMDSVVRCTGQLLPVKGGVIGISVPVSGFVQSVAVQEGQRVQKGQVLVTVGGNELVELQRELAVSAAEFERFELEYSRLKLLYDQKAVSEKEFQVIRSEFKRAQAIYQSLKLKIQGLGLSTMKIEEGDFYTSYSLRAPMSGQIRALDIQPGAGVESGHLLAEIVNTNQLQLKMAVYESDAGLVQTGQRVQFRLGSEEMVKAVVSRIAVGLSEPSRTLQVFADVSTDRPLLVNQLVECELIVSSSRVSAVPSEAVVQSEAGPVVLLLEKKEKGKYYFNPLHVVIGRQMNGYTEIKSDAIKGEILVKGLNTIQL